MDKVNNFIENLKQNSLRDIDLSLLLEKDYILDMNPTKHFIYEQWIYVIVLINLMIAGIGFIFISKKFLPKRPIYRFIRKVSFFWFCNTIFLLFYNLVRSEGVSLLSMRVFLVIFLISYFGIILYAVYYYFFSMAKELDKFNKAKLRDKYSINKKRS